MVNFNSDHDKNVHIQNADLKLSSLEVCVSELTRISLIVIHALIYQFPRNLALDLSSIYLG